LISDAHRVSNKHRKQTFYKERDMKYVFDLKIRDFRRAREFSRSLKLKNRKEWDEWCKKSIKSKPKDIPVFPNLSYKNNGWINYKDWLGY
tara:strand:- start:445 stop:714 length:270 start_codon:yes stop_codon:yes gene_type:complete